jgi:hypothetical protein
MRLMPDSQLRALLRGSVCVVALGTFGCATEVLHTADEETGSTHAVITVDRSEVANRQLPARAGAAATFVRVPVAVDSASALALMGLELELPETYECAVQAAHRDPSVPLSPIDQIELLDAGDVSVTAADVDTTLAPRAFPTVTDFVSGVVYTTRDLSAEPLPAAVSYTVRAAGSTAVEPLELSGEAPRALSGVTLGGVPLAEVRSVSPSAPINLGWSVGDAGDLVYVELNAEGAACMVCAFRDEDGAGSVPAGAFSGRGAGRIAVHRVRSQVFESTGIQSGELRFDFELATDVTFGE